MNPDVGVATSNAARTTVTVARACDRPPTAPHWTGRGRNWMTSVPFPRPNVAQLPPTGAVRVVTPLPMIGASGSSARVLALVESVQEVTDVGS